jgi:hypothetical protein
MAYEFEPNPFETSEADKAANLARVKAAGRDELDRISGGSDGIILDGINRVIGQGQMERMEEPVEQIAKGFGEAAGDLGVLAVTGPSLAAKKIRRQ